MVLAAQAIAQTPAVDPDRLKAAQQVDVAMGGVEHFSKVIEAMRPALIKLIIDSAHVSMSRAASQVDTVLVPELQAHKAAIFDAKARILAEHFTVDELRQIEIFYRSAVGQKLIADQAAIGNETMTAMQPLMRDMRAHAMALAEQEAKEGGKSP